MAIKRLKRNSITIADEYDCAAKRQRPLRAHEGIKKVLIKIEIVLGSLYEERFEQWRNRTYNYEVKKLGERLKKRRL